MINTILIASIIAIAIFAAIEITRIIADKKLQKHHRKMHESAAMPQRKAEFIRTK
ncbi:hypothetical protein OAI07_01200 [Akkermansiaceae bacterium]|nr:hypothetical protein [Akkermansiaceae bacterium]